MGKVVVSEDVTLDGVGTTMKDPNWNNSTVLAGDVIHEVSKLSRS